MSSDIQNLLEYLYQSHEKSNEDLALGFFRSNFGKAFDRQSDAEGADGYVPGKFVLELKGKTGDWLSGFFEGLARKNRLDFQFLIIAAKGILAAWDIQKIPKEIQLAQETKAPPSKIGEILAGRFRKKTKQILKKACWSILLNGEVAATKKPSDDDLVQKLEQLIRIVNSGKTRQKLTSRNFKQILREMVPFFETPLMAIRAFYSMIYGWKENSVLELSHRMSSEATLNGERIQYLIAGKTNAFKKFVESYYVTLDGDESLDDFFAKYDQAIDAVDPEFRVTHGIFFTDIDLSKFAMWLVKQHIPDLGKNYLVIDPAAGSGNLVTNWRSPLQLRHKVVSDIEPELLFAIEKRMKGDSWHNGKFTVIPKVEENQGLNFLDKSAEKYLNIISTHLSQKGLRADKPIAFLTNPPYRGDDDQSADSIDYDIHQSILELTGNDAGAERYCCFLAQMKLICKAAKDSGLPGNSVLLLFSKSAWLTGRPTFKKIRSEIFGSFEDQIGILVNNKEFFEAKGKFPVVFSIWKFENPRSKLDANRSIPLIDLTWVTKADLAQLPWNNSKALDEACNDLMSDPRAISVHFGNQDADIRDWLGQKRVDFTRSRRRDEKNQLIAGGLPINDRRQRNKKTYGESDGGFIGFMDDVTPCRVKKGSMGHPWFRLNAQFMDVRKTRCFSGPPDNRGYRAYDRESAEKCFFWFSLARTFVQFPYPLWVDALEMWAPKMSDALAPRIRKLSFAIGFAENECVEAWFPANNPILKVPELHVPNPMSPILKDSFWTRFLSSEFSTSGDDVADKLVASVKHVFKLWENILGSRDEIFVDYEAQYFLGEKRLTRAVGLIQIFDYARDEENELLLTGFRQVSQCLQNALNEFNRLLWDPMELNYFNILSAEEGKKAA